MPEIFGVLDSAVNLRINIYVCCWRWITRNRRDPLKPVILSVFGCTLIFVRFAPAVLGLVLICVYDTLSGVFSIVSLITYLTIG